MDTKLEMTDEQNPMINGPQRAAAWLVHIFTATGAVLGLLALDAISRNDFRWALWLMGAAIVVDAADGSLARRVRIKAAVPQIDGALLDNLIDYFNYVMVPAFFIIAAQMLPMGLNYAGAILVTMVSSFQFTQVDAKTEDHFFKGFPSYWNIAVLYLYLWETAPWTNLFIIVFLSVLVFVPVKYVYPSRLEYLTRNPRLRRAMLLATLLWGVGVACLLWIYPKTNGILRFISIGYILLYALVSVYRTFYPLEKDDAIDKDAEDAGC